VIHLLRKNKRRIIRSTSINTFIKVYSWSKEIWWPQRLLSPVCVQMFSQSVFELWTKTGVYWSVWIEHY
jgi:hypothetical protein